MRDIITLERVSRRTEESRSVAQRTADGLPFIVGEGDLNKSSQWGTHDAVSEERQPIAA